MPWLWRYGLVSLHPFHHREQEHGNDVTPRKRRHKKVYCEPAAEHILSHSRLKRVDVEGD